MRTFVIGDIHGNYKALVQVLERSGFNYEEDMLITLGDIVDGCQESFECVQELLKIRHRIDIRGNHDATFYNWMKGEGNPFAWTQGGIHTARSYAKGHGYDMHEEAYYQDNIFGEKEKRYNISLHHASIDLRHFQFFHRQVKFYVDDKNRAFVHAGYTHPDGLGFEDESVYLWSRDLWQKNAMIPSQNTPKLLRPYSKIFIGHTQTLLWDETKPMLRYNTWNLDTGAGHPDGKLTIMDLETEEYWQSDFTHELYPDYKYEK